MGDISDGIINGDFDMYSGEYLGPGGGFPRTKYTSKKETIAEKKIRLVRKELAVLINANKKLGVKNYVNESRKFINLKYGKGWRERGLVSNSDNQWTEENNPDLYKKL